MEIYTLFYTPPKGNPSHQVRMSGWRVNNKSIPLEPLTVSLSSARSTPQRGRDAEKEGPASKCLICLGCFEDSLDHWRSGALGLKIQGFKASTLQAWNVPSIIEADARWCRDYPNRVGWCSNDRLEFIAIFTENEVYLLNDGFRMFMNFSADWPQPFSNFPRRVKSYPDIFRKWSIFCRFWHCSDFIWVILTPKNLSPKKMFSKNVPKYFWITFSTIFWKTEI